MGAYRLRATRVCFDGQSLNWVPTLNTTFPVKIVKWYFPDVPAQTVAVSGVSWTLLTPSAPYRVDNWAATVPYTILCMCGGTSDLWGPENNDGPTVYADMAAYAGARRAAGFDYVIATTIAPSTTFNATMETNRQAANTLIMGDASNVFDAQVDVNNDPFLQDPSNTAAYFDGTHYTGAATTIVANLLRPAFTAAFALAP